MPQATFLVLILSLFVLSPTPNNSQDAQRSVWLQAGCEVRSESKDQNGSNRLVLSCPGATFDDKQTPCAPLMTVPDALRVLSKRTPLLECHGPASGWTPITGVLRAGCLFGHWISYVAYDHQKFRMLKSWPDFREFFGPVTTADEALAYAAALTGASPRYTVEAPPKYKPLIKNIQPTRVTADKTGFVVRLFEQHACVINPTWQAVDMHVATDGTVKELSRKDVFTPKSGHPNACCMD
jgi:hypothetical protein